MADESNYTLLAQPSWQAVKPLAQISFAFFINSMRCGFAVAVRNISTLSLSVQNMNRST